MILASASLETSVSVGSDRCLSRSEMAGQMLVHLEHGHLVGSENQPQFFVGDNFASVLRVLQVVSLDIGPDFAHGFCAGQRFWALTAASSGEGCKEVFRPAGALTVSADAFLPCINILLSIRCSTHCTAGVTPLAFSGPTDNSSRRPHTGISLL
jgi:hypothetical protein